MQDFLGQRDFPLSFPYLLWDSRWVWPSWEVVIEEDGIGFFHLEFTSGGERPNDFVLGFQRSQFGH